MYSDQIKLHLIVFIWGFTSILGVLISIPSVEIVFYRTLISAIALVGVLWAFNKTPFIKWRMVLKLVGTGFLVGLHWILFFASAKVSNVSICLAGVATCSLFTAFLEPLIKKTSIKWYEVMIGLMVLSGLYIIFHFEFGHFLGLSLSLMAAFTAAIFSILNSNFSKAEDPIVITFYEMVGACLCCILVFPFYSNFLSESGSLQLDITLMDGIYLSILALVCTVLAFYVSVDIMKRVSAFNVNLTINLEPVYGIILAFVMFGEKEQMSPGFYAGTLVILVSVLLYPVLDKYLSKRRRRKQELTA
ncbi:DMT family transporter [Flammeovirgaceae bacterium SG7u.111]|nr:DMT family transporter [Flammeovirgaceae bacterium SG7u.132]WPO37386.1 DMT family transporter [Flammeovirgaceae bacterium SG7u.111]